MTEQLGQIRIIKENIALSELKKIAEELFGDMVKAVVDIERTVMAIGGEMHADAEQLLIEKGSRQDDLWGFNIYPEAPSEKMLEYVSFINIRPKLGNRSQEINSQTIKDRIKALINKMIV